MGNERARLLESLFGELTTLPWRNDRNGTVRSVDADVWNQRVTPILRAIDLLTAQPTQPHRTPERPPDWLRSGRHG